MIQLNKVGAIFIKQIKDTLKDTQVLVLYIVYPLLGFIMVTAIAPQVGEENFFIKIFCVYAYGIFTYCSYSFSSCRRKREKYFKSINAS